MPDKLRVAVGTTTRRRLGGDIPMRNDLLSHRNNNDYITSMISHVSPNSPFLVFTGLFGESMDMNGEREGLFDVQTSTIGSEFIRIQEEIEEKRPFYVVDNSRVPTTLVAGQPFEVGLDYAVLDEGEQVQLFDQRTMLTVVSRRNTSNRVVDVTFILNGQDGDTADGSLLATGKPINIGFGNTKGEGSENSNTIPMHGSKKNIFTNPTVITRYMWKETGSWMSDEVFRFKTEKAMDGTEPMEFNTSISVKAFRHTVNSLEGMIMDSVTNFNPETLEVNSFNSTNNSYPDLPTYAGIWQQMDQAHVKIPHPWKNSYINNFNRLESIQHQIHEIWPDADIMIVAQGPGVKFVRDAIREGGQAKYPVRLTREVPASGKVDIGFGIDELINDNGRMFLYDIGKGYRTNGEYKTFTYNGVKGPDRSRDIFFIPMRRGDNGARKKIVKYFTKSGKNGAHQQVDRGFVFGKVKGFTGEGNGFTGSQMMAMQSQAIEDMVKNTGAYDLGSVVDGNQYHMMFEGVPYVDITGIIKLHLVD